MDLHPRKDKYGHACCSAIKYQRPAHPLTLVELTCNFPEGDNAELTFDQARTFFHEMFQGIHVLCGSARVKWCLITGYEVETDFVQSPSQVIEAWLQNPTFLKSFTINADGEVIPNHLDQEA